MGTQTHTFAFTQARNEWHFHKTEEEQELPAQQTKTSSLKHPVSTQLPVVNPFRAAVSFWGQLIGIKLLGI